MTTRRPARRRRSLLTPLTVGVGALALAIGLGVALGSDDSDESEGLVRTGEQSAMGTPVVETPGSASGVAVAGGVEVSGANWALGDVPLNTAVRPMWRLRNTSTAPVTVGEPHPEVREGCCPGPLTVGSSSIPAGSETTLTFELSMHAGMDGYHDFAVHVPVSSEGGDDVVTLGVTGDFGDG